jgi:hypothetical protein
MTAFMTAAVEAIVAVSPTPLTPIGLVGLGLSVPVELEVRQPDRGRQLVPPLDPYTPELGPGQGERPAFRAMRWAWLVLLVLVAAVIRAALR